MIELPKGERVGPFEIVRKLPGGEGGMAVVYEARLRNRYRTPGAPKRVALKIARADRFDFLKDEANFLRRFNHPGVVRVYPLPGREKEVYVARQTFTTGPSYYIAMEYIGGGSLADYLRHKRHGRLSVRRAVQIALQVASALEHIHARGVINLDVKPTNILFRHSWSRRLLGLTPQAVLCDFGIARDMQYPTYGAQAATAAYMSPEQLWSTGHNSSLLLDHRSDIYSLGVVLYEMLTGETPFSDTGLVVDDEQPQPPSTRNSRVSTELDAVVMRALAKDREARFQTAREMITALQAIPLPVDWSSLLKRAGVVVALVIGITALTLLGRARINSAINSTSTPITTPTIVCTWTPSPTAIRTPRTPTSTPVPATSTPVPTYTSTPTKMPTPTCTPTYTPVPQ
ncbi:MAG: serine/threonine protein kinase [Anaerolineae bacterium]|nr:serine/threonine protein kinase [Anaerolineae bacterium]